MLTCSISSNWVDQEVYKHWLEGENVDEVAEHLSIKMSNSDNLQSSINVEFINQYVVEQFATIKSAVKFMTDVNLFCVQTSNYFKSYEERIMLTKSYFDVDMILLGEIFFNRMALKYKKELSQKLSIRPRICKRHIENIKLMVKLCKDKNKFCGSFFKTIMTHMKLDKTLALTYAGCVFIIIYKLDIPSKELPWITDIQVYLDCIETMFLLLAPQIHENWAAYQKKTATKVTEIYNVQELFDSFGKPLKEVTTLMKLTDFFGDCRNCVFNIILQDQQIVNEVMPVFKVNFRVIQLGILELCERPPKSVKKILKNIAKIIILSFKKIELSLDITSNILIVFTKAITCLLLENKKYSKNIKPEAVKSFITYMYLIISIVSKLYN